MAQYNIDPFGKMAAAERWISKDKLQRQQMQRQNALQDVQNERASLQFDQGQQSYGDKQNFMRSARENGIEAAVKQFPVIGQEFATKQASPGSSTDIWKYANLAEDKWDIENPGVPMPPSKKMAAMMDIKRAQDAEVGRNRQAVSDVDLDMKPKIEGASKFAEMQGSQRSQRIDKSYTKIEAINKNLTNIDNAIDAVKLGANTGAITKRFPSIIGSSVLLDQVQGRLALDVIGSVTFGALSKGELDLAKAIAIPTGLEGAPLIQWLEDRKAAQQKLLGYYGEQIEFLDNGGTIAGFLRSKKRDSKKSDENVIRFDANGEIIQ